MPAEVTYLYTEWSDSYRSGSCVQEPRATYGAGDPVPETCRLLGDNIRFQRRLLRWSQEALGLEAGLHRTLIGSIERAEVNTSLGTAEKIARALGMSVAELLLARPPSPYLD